MSDLQRRVDEFAQDFDHTAHAKQFVDLDRWTGDDPLLLLADAAGTTTGQNYFKQVKPSVEDFPAQFLESFEEFVDDGSDAEGDRGSLIRQLSSVISYQ
jgi:hypothetical protein